MWTQRRWGAEFIAVILLALARFGFCCYRAAHQSITIDEAFMFDRFLNGPWELIHGKYDAANHVLYSMLAKVSIETLGLSEFAYRLPSLIAGFAFVIGIYLVLECISSRWIRWIALLALSLHPLLLDFSIAARGYGLGLALLTWALVFAMKKRYALAGTMLGLGVSANLTIGFPAVALMFAAMVCERGRVADRLKILWPMIATAEAIFVLLCFLPLRTAERASFYLGVPTMTESLTEMVYSSLRGGHNSGIIGSDRGAWVVAIFVVPALGVFMVWASAGWLFRNRDDSTRLIPVVTLLTSVAGILLSHAVFNLAYPVDRTGLYLIPLFGLAWAIAADGVSNRRLRGAQIALACLFLAQFATQMRMRYFQDWMFDADTKHIAMLLKEATDGKPDQSVSVHATWIYAESINFYREYFKIAALKPLRRQAPTALSGADYFVLNEPDTNDPVIGTMKVLFRGRASGVVFATE